MKNVILSLTVLAIFGGACNGQAADREDARASDFSFWFDVAYKISKKNTVLPAQDNVSACPGTDGCVSSGKVSYGVGVKYGEYLGMGFWAGQTADYTKDVAKIPTYDEIPYAYYTKYPNNVPHRETYGYKYGLDFLAFCPVTDRLSLFAGPGVFRETTSEFVSSDGKGANMIRNDYSGRTRLVGDDRRVNSFAASGGIAFRVGPEDPILFIKDLEIKGGYHSERGATAGLSFKW